MFFLNYFLQLLLIFVGSAHLMPSNGTTDQEMHTFRWTLGADLNNTICVTAVVPPRHPNTIAEAEYWNFAWSECILLCSYRLFEIESITIYLEFLQFVNGSPEEKRARCQSNSSLFTLIGNPGVIWHLKSNQCLHTSPEL